MDGASQGLQAWYDLDVPVPAPDNACDEGFIMPLGRKICISPRLCVGVLLGASIFVACLGTEARADDPPGTVKLLEQAGGQLKRNADGGITDVRLQGPAPTEELLEALSTLPQLRSLVLAETETSDQQLAVIGRLSRLRNLDLRGCPIGNAGLAQLVGMTDLAAIRFSGESGATTVDDAGMMHLAKLPSLRTVMLDFLWVSEEGLALLTPLRDLTELTLAQTLIGDESLPIVARFTKLRRLRLARTPVTGAGLMSLTGLGELRDLDLSECASLDDAAVEPVGQLQSLQRLNLWRVPIGDAGVARLQSLTRLQWLNIDNTLLSDAGLEALTGMERLETLHLGSTAVSNAGVPMLEKLTSLRELFLARTAVDEVGITQLQKALPRTRIVSAAD